MPSVAHQAPDEEPTSLAPVVDLTSRRGGKAVSVEDAMRNVTDADLQERAAEHWRRVFEDAGMNLSDRDTAATAVLLARELERLVGGLLVIREGREDLPANPDAGVDFTSAVEVTGVLRDLARAAQPGTKRD